MKAITVNQYSVFLVNEAGTLKKFAKMLYDEGLDIIGLASDIRYEAAVVKFVVASNNPGQEKDVNQIITQAGYTSVKTEILSVEEEGRDGTIMEVSTLLGDAGINITTIYGSCVDNKHGKMFVVVDDVEHAVEILNTAFVERRSRPSAN